MCPLKNLTSLLLITAPALAHGNVLPPSAQVFVLDEGTNIVMDRSTGIEWLQWTETTGMSIYEALNLYQDDGWRVASEGQMAGLYRRFFPHVTWDDDPNTYQTNLGATAPEGVDLWFHHDGIDPSLAFGELFGQVDHLSLNGGIYVNNQELENVSGRYYTEAIYGAELNADGYYNWARAWTETTGQLPDGTVLGFSDWASLGSSHYFGIHSSWVTSGIALIRDTRPHKVPEPSSLTLLGIAVLGLFRARRVRSSTSSYRLPRAQFLKFKVLDQGVVALISEVDHRADVLR